MMTETTATIPTTTLYVEQAAHLLNLPLHPDHQPGVVENFSRIQTIAQLFLDFPLPETIEPAPLFQP